MTAISERLCLLVTADLLFQDRATKLRRKSKRKIGRPPMKRMIFVSLLLIALPAGEDLEAKGRIGAARGFGSFGSGRLFGFGFRGPVAHGYGLQRFCYPGFRSGPVFHRLRFGHPRFGFGYYAPLYTFGGHFSSLDSEISSLSSHAYYANDDSRSESPVKNMAQPNPKTNCNDGGADRRHDFTPATIVPTR
jgi:hypothetical protein